MIHFPCIIISKKEWQAFIERLFSKESRRDDFAVRKKEAADFLLGKTINIQQAKDREAKREKFKSELQKLTDEFLQKQEA